MATNDIGVRIGLEGEADFRRQLKLITQQSKELDAEMKALVSSFDANDRSQENLTKQSQLLSKQIDTQRQKIDLLNTQYDKATSELGRLAAELQDTIQAYGEQSQEAVKAQRAYQNQSTAVSKLKTDINNATTALNKMERQQEGLTAELKDSGDAFERASKAISDNQDELERLKREYSNLVLEQKDATDEAQDLARQIDKLSTELSDSRSALKRAADAADELDNSLDDVDDAADDAGRGMSNFADIVGGNVIADGISGIIDGIKDLHESSIEYRTIMASLETSSERAGYTAAQTEESYKKLVGVLGDTQTAATTVANLQAIGYEQEDLQKAIDGVIGAWATYGDSIPIDSLSEAVNETINVGTVTGTFADVLNWANVSEDDFNELLASANDKTERANIVLKQLARQGLTEAGKGWQENNESLVEYNKSQDDLDAALADLGETAEPTLTFLTEALTAALDVINRITGIISRDWNNAVDTVSDFFLELGGNGNIEKASEQTEALRKIYAEFGNEVGREIEMLAKQNGFIEGSINGMDLLSGAVEEVTGRTLDSIDAKTADSELIAEVTEKMKGLTVEQQKQVTEQVNQSNAVKGTTEYYALYNDIISEVTGKTQENTGAVNQQLTAYQGLDSETQTMVVNVTSAITSMTETIANAAQTQMDWFGAIDESVGITSESVLESMRTQLDAFNAWGENLSALANRTDVTVNDELLQYLANMGPQGAEYAAAFASMTTEQLQEANSMWEESINIQNMTTSWGQDLITGVGTMAAGGQQAFADLSSQLNSDAAQAGVYTGQGFIEGVQSIVDQAATATEEMGDASILALQEALGVASPSTITREFGRFVDDGLRYGIIDNQAQVAKQAQALAKLVTDTIKNNLPETNTKPAGIAAAQGVRLGLIEGQLSPVQQAASLDRLVIAAINNNISQSSTYSAGLNAAYGLAAGIRAGQSSAINAAANMAANALAAARSRLRIHSPSKAFEELGDLSVEGFALGFDNNEAVKQMERTMNAMLAQAATLAQAQSNYAPIESAIRSIPAGNTDIQIVVNAADGQSAEQIANMVMYKMQHAVNQKKAVWG